MMQYEQPHLSEAEWALIYELLTMERESLREMVQAGRSSDTRADLHERLNTVDGVLRRIREGATAVGA